MTSTALQRSDWDGEMIADVSLIPPRPQALAHAKTASGAYYRDHQLDAWDRYEGVGEQDLTRNSYLLTNVRLLWQLSAGTLPEVKEIPTCSTWSAR